MTINLQKPDITELKPRITVFGVGGGGGNAVNNMIRAGLEGVEFVVANTDAQALSSTVAERVIQMGHSETQGLGAGSDPTVGRAAAEECISEIKDHLAGTHMCFVTAGMGGGTGTGAAAVVAKAARDQGILTVGVVTKPFDFEGKRRMEKANDGIVELAQNVDTLIVIPNQNLFRIANDKTGFADAFAMADQVLYSGVACITDLMVKEGLINLDFADVRSVMAGMGNAMMGTGEASGEDRARLAAEDAISNPLLDTSSMKGAKGLLISITGGRDITLFEVDEAATRIREEVDEDANIIVGATFDESLEGTVRVSVVATGVERAGGMKAQPIGVAGVPFGAPQQVAQPAGVAAAAQTEALKAEQAIKSAADIAKIERELQVPKPSNIDPAVKIKPARPVPQIPSLDAELEEGFKQALSGELATPTQPAATRPVQAPVSTARPAPRMPHAEEFSPLAQAQLAAQAGELNTQADERSALGLFKRLTNGLGAKEAETLAVAPNVGSATQSAIAPQPTPNVGGVQAYAPQPRRQETTEENLFSPSQQPLDELGRAAQPSKVEDDQLDIPAFLRRQA